MRQNIHSNLIQVLSTIIFPFLVVLKIIISVNKMTIINYFGHLVGHYFPIYIIYV